MAAFMPAWRPFDTSHSARLLSERPGHGRVVALCAGPAMAGTSEGARLAVDVARRWAEEGLSVVLADGNVGKAPLHGLLGVSNGTGFAEILLSGSAWEPTALPTATPGLQIIPAGGSAAPSASHAARAQLAALCQGVMDQGATLVLYVPLGSMVAEWAIEACTDVVVLASEGEHLTSYFARDEDRIRALVGSPLRAALGLTPRSFAPDPGTDPVGDRVRDRAPDRVVERGPDSPPPPPPPSPPAPERRPRDPQPEAPSTRPSSARIEEKWLEAAAQLRARNEQWTSLGPPRGRESSPAVEKPRAHEPPPAAAKPRAFEPLPPGKARPPAVAPAGHIRSAGPALNAPPARRPAPDPDEGDQAPRGPPSGGRRAAVLRALGIILGVAVVAGIVWVWSIARSLPPYESQSTALPRAAVPPETTAADLRATEAEGQALLPTETSDTTSVAEAPGTTTEVGTPVETPEATPAAEAGGRSPVPVAAGTGGAPHQRFSWSMAALGDLGAARAMAARFRRAAPDHAFIVAPIVVNGRTLFRVLGGLAEDRDGLVALRDGLAQETGEAPGPWLVREAPWAFALEDFDDPAAAAERAQGLWIQGVPVYVLVLDLDDGTRVHRIYAGAYANESEAGVLRAILETAGVRGMTLTERRGRVGG